MQFVLSLLFCSRSIFHVPLIPLSVPLFRCLFSPISTVRQVYRTLSHKGWVWLRRLNETEHCVGSQKQDKFEGNCKRFVWHAIAPEVWLLRFSKFFFRRCLCVFAVAIAFGEEKNCTFSCMGIGKFKWFISRVLFFWYSIITRCVTIPQRPLTLFERICGSIDAFRNWIDSIDYSLSSCGFSPSLDIKHVAVDTITEFNGTVFANLSQIQFPKWVCRKNGTHDRLKSVVAVPTFGKGPKAITLLHGHFGVVKSFAWI